MKINVTQSSMPNFQEYVEEIKDIFDSKWLTNMGPKHKILTEKLKEYLSVENISLFSNGHLALELVIQAFELKGEIITTPFTFASTTHAIARNGITPVFCDINDKDYTIDVNKIESLITEKTSAIIPVHVYGNICDVKKIDEIAKKYDLKVIYDAAHTFGVRVNDIGVGEFGDASMFSFHATKVFNTIEGGAITFKNKEIEKILYNLKNFGIKGPETVEYVGSNAKMNEFQAAMGICNLRHIDEEISKRKAVVERYNQNLKNINGIKLNNIPEEIKSNYAYYPVVFDNYKKTRDEIDEQLKANGIISRKYFYPLITDFDCYKDKYVFEKKSVAKHISDRVLTLPLYSDLPLLEVDKICDIILK